MFQRCMFYTFILTEVWVVAPKPVNAVLVCVLPNRPVDGALLAGCWPNNPC